MLLETVVIYVYCGAEFTATNMESKMTNFTTQEQYQTFCDYLNALCSKVKVHLGINSDPSKGYPNKGFKDNLGERAVLVSDPSDGAEYGIEPGKLYPPSLLLHINVLLKAEGKDLPIWHSDYESLEHHTRQVCSKDFRFIHQIDALPKTADDRVIVEDPEIKLQPLPDAVKELIDEVIDGNVDEETPREIG